MKSFVVLALFIAAACGSSARTSARGKTASNFAWSPPCRVPVTEVMISGKLRAKLRYDVVVTAHGEDSLQVTREHVEFLEVEGKPLAQWERDNYATTAHWLELYPAIIIDESGALVDLGDITPFVDAMIAHTTVAPDDAERAKVERTQLARWSGWVALWRDWSLTPGQHLEGPMDGELEGTEGTMRLEHLGYAANRAHLRVVMESKGAGLAAIIPDVFLRIVESVERTAPGARFDLTAATSRMTYEVVTDPKTLRPDRASYEGVTQIPVHGRPPGEHREGYETTFDWAHATGCGKP